MYQYMLTVLFITKTYPLNEFPFSLSCILPVFLYLVDGYIMQNCCIIYYFQGNLRQLLTAAFSSLGSGKREYTFLRRTYATSRRRDVASFDLKGKNFSSIYVVSTATSTSQVFFCFLQPLQVSRTKWRAHTVWKFCNFSITQILREIDFWRIQKFLIREMMFST